MKKYKHKTTGIIAKEQAHFACYVIEDQKFGKTLLDVNIIENSNDWELIESSLSRADTIKLSHKEEPNYLITAFRNSRNQVFTIYIDGLYYFKDWHERGFKGLSLEDCTTGTVLDIYSVKNSKGEEFTIGDKFNVGPHQNEYKFEILSFFIDKNKIVIRIIVDGIKDKIFLEDAVKIKSPIYTTTDNNAIFKGDSLTLFLLRKLDSHCILPYQKVDIFQFSEQDKEVADRYLTFTSEENRDKYIKENTKKPIFVSADNVEYFETGETIKLHGVWIGENDPISYDKFDKIKHEHLLKESYPINTTNWLWFTDEKLAQEYIDNNKPKYSLVDIETAYDKAMNTEYDGLGEIIDELKKLGK